MKFHRIMLLFAIMQTFSAASPKTLQQMQNLYKDIGNDLMSIRKEFPGAQPKVYSVLDRVDKMYNLAKVASEKKHKLRDSIKNQSSESKRLNDEINTLKIKLDTAESELIKTHNKLDAKNKELQNEKSTNSKLAEEKSKLSKAQGELQSNLNKINSEKGKSPLSKELMHEIKDLNGLSDEEKALLKQAQSLSLSSTSAPNSPR